MQGPKTFLPKGIDAKQLQGGRLLTTQEQAYIESQILPERAQKGNPVDLVNPEGDLLHPIYFDSQNRMYVIYKLLGEGAFGKTFLAQNNVTGEFVAVKLQIATIDDPNQQKVQDEAGFMQLIGSLQDIAKRPPNQTWIVQTLFDGKDCSKSTVKLYQNEEPVQHEILKKVTDQRREEAIKEIGQMQSAPKDKSPKKKGLFSSKKSKTKAATPKLPRPTEEFLLANGPLLAIQLKFFGSVLQDLIDIHKKRILHMDIKPENMIMGPDGQVHIIDFGLSVKMRQDGTSTEEPRGTPGYIAPELYSGDRLSVESDIFSFGTTFITDFKLPKYIELFNGILFDKQLGDELISLINLMVDPIKLMRPSLAKVQLVLDKLNQDILLKQGLDLLNCSGADFMQYISALRSNGDINAAKVHMGQTLTGQKALDAIVNYLQSPDKNNLTMQDYQNILNRIDKIPHSAKVPQELKKQIVEAKQQHDAKPPADILQLINKLASPEQIMALLNPTEVDTKSVLKFKSKEQIDMGTKLAAQVIGFLKAEFGVNIANQQVLATYIKGLLSFLEKANLQEPGPEGSRIRTDQKLVNLLMDVVSKYPKDLPLKNAAEQSFIQDVLQNPQLNLPADMRSCLDKVISELKTSTPRMQP